MSIEIEAQWHTVWNGSASKDILAAAWNDISELEGQPDHIESENGQSTVPTQISELAG